MSKFSRRLLELRCKAGLSRKALAQKVGISQSSVNMYERGEREPGIETLEAFADYFNVDMEYLIGKTDQNTQYDFSLPSNLQPTRQAQFRPLLGVIACGDPILADENVETYIPVPQDIRCDFLLRCKGDSMVEANIKDGDYVYIRQQDTVENGEIAAVLVIGVDAEATLKRVYVEDDCITLAPCNSSMSPKTLSGEQAATVRILGKAVAVTSKIN